MTTARERFSRIVNEVHQKYSSVFEVPAKNIYYQIFWDVLESLN